MPIFITGGGEQESFHALDLEFINQLPQDARILVIPFACEEDEYIDAYERVLSCFDHEKIQEIVLGKNLDELSFSQINSFDALFIEGGNTFKLISEVRSSSFFNHLKEYLEDGKIIYADSAGAIILGANIKTAFFGELADEDHESLQSYHGLNLIKDWAVHCHYHPDDHDEIQDMMYDIGIPVIALAEPCGLLIDGDRAVVFGERPLELFSFSGRTLHQPGEELNLKDQ